MKLLTLQITNWDQIHYSKIPDFEYKIGDRVVFHMDSGQDVGHILSEVDLEESELRNPVRDIVRLATDSDLSRLEGNNRDMASVLSYCREMIEKHKLPMKLVNCHISFDGNRIVFGFIADGRVDFRNLVKDLSQHFKKSIRLQQMGIRDEARICGDIGPCGCELCCRKFLKQLDSVTSEYAKIQGVEQRGCDRLSGACGRLKCCLAFEAKYYKERSDKLPPIGSKIKTKKGNGIVQGHNVVKQSVNVQIEPGNIIEVPLGK